MLYMRTLPNVIVYKLLFVREKGKGDTNVRSKAIVVWNSVSQENND